MQQQETQSPKTSKSSNIKSPIITNTTMDKDVLLSVKGLKKHFPIKKDFFGNTLSSVKAVDGLSFDIKKGETLGMVGESGCGKTTAGRTLLRLLEPTAGSAHYQNEKGIHDIFNVSGQQLNFLRQDLQIIFQDPYSSLNPRMSVSTIVGEALEVHGLATGSELEDKLAGLMTKVGLLPEHLSRYPHEFSGGQRQRIGIARALAMDPKFIVCDEAVSALDVSIQAQVLNLLNDLQEELELSYLFISHDLSVVRHISDRIAVMYLGRIVEIADADELFHNPKHPYAQLLLSAIPVPTARREKRKRTLISGDVPNPINPPKGCHFHPRCPDAMDVCKTGNPPELISIGGNREAACHLFEAAV